MSGDSADRRGSCPECLSAMMCQYWTSWHVVIMVDTMHLLDRASSVGIQTRFLHPKLHIRSISQGSLRPLPNIPKNVFLAGCRWVFPKFESKAPLPNIRSQFFSTVIRGQVSSFLKLREIESPEVFRKPSTLPACSEGCVQTCEPTSVAAQVQGTLQTFGNTHRRNL